MPGIEDLENIMVTGSRDDIPLSPVGASPIASTTPQPPMGGPPPLPTGDPAAMETLMANADMLGAGTERPPMEGGGGIEQDAMALADAVVGRAQGDINAALAILDGAAQIVMSSGQQELPMQQEQPLMANSGMPLTQAGQNELDTRMHKIRDYEDYDQDNSVTSQGGKFDEIVNRIRDFQRSS